MLRRRSNTQNISWFVDQYSFGRLDLEPPYQRKSVWTPEYRRFFIDTVLNNYPCPTIFLNSELQPDGSTIYHVIDGKQRLTTVFDYLHDYFKTTRTTNTVIAEKYFSELDQDLKTEFFEYTFTVENISGADVATLNEAFDRLNRNVAKLSDQELRHARYNGAFITLAETLAGDPLWKEIGIATPANIRRMKDIEFVSEILLLTMNGISDGKADVLDKFYAEYEEIIPDEELHRERYERCKNIILDMGLPIKETRLSNMSDFYTLWAAISYKMDMIINLDATKSNILSFLQEIDEVHKGLSSSSDAVAYYNAVRQGCI